MSSPEAQTDHLLALDQSSVWLQANRNFGNCVEGLSNDWQENRTRGLALLGGHTAANRLVRMKPLNQTGFIDLDTVTVEDLHRTDGFVTTDPTLVLLACPADCGEVAVTAFSERQERPVIGLFHASTKIVGEGGHLRGVEYMAAQHNIDPANMSVRLSPSARAESYQFDDIYEEQKTSPAWQDYIYRDEQGKWHIDPHNRTIDELQKFGIPAANIIATPIDTITDDDYFSHHRAVRRDEQIGGNGLFFALR